MGRQHKFVILVVIISLSLPINLLAMERNMDNDDDDVRLSHTSSLSQGSQNNKALKTTQIAQDDEPTPPDPKTLSPEALEEGEDENRVGTRKIDCTERTCNIVTNLIMVLFVCGFIPYLLYLINTSPIHQCKCMEI